MTKSVRNSRRELLRILSMMMVLGVHFVGATFGLPSCEELRHPTSTMVAKELLEVLMIVGVNCFVLISGFFSIHFSVRGLLRFTTICLVASLTVWAYQWVETGETSLQSLWDAVRVYSNTDLWFVPAYLGLFVLSPFINAGCDVLTSRRMLGMLLVLTFLNVYLGWYWSGKVNPTGYCMMQLVYVYFIGRTLQRFMLQLQRISSYAYFIMYLLATACVFVSAMVLPYDKALAYNSPFVLASSVALFLTFAVGREFNNSIINRLAAASFWVYLLHKSPYFWIKLRNLLLNFDCRFDGVEFIGWCLFLFFGVYACTTIYGLIYNNISRNISRMLSSRGKR